MSVGSTDFHKLNNQELADKMREFVEIRDGPKLDNSAWEMMLEASNRLRTKRDEWSVTFYPEPYSERIKMAALEAKYWQNAFWGLVYKKGSYVNDLQLRIEAQAAKIMKLELMLSFIRRVGDGVFVSSHARLMELYRLYKDNKPFPQPKGIRRSRYLGSRHE